MLDFPLRPFQQRALKALEKKQSHVIGMAPTGAGKSLIFQKYAFENPQKKILLISPLIALARQQKRDLDLLGISCWLGVGPEIQTPDPQSQFWILSPERISHSKKNSETA